VIFEVAQTFVILLFRKSNRGFLDPIEALPCGDDPMMTTSNGSRIL
jgi:hypothetical protein